MCVSELSGCGFVGAPSAGARRAPAHPISSLQLARCGYRHTFAHGTRRPHIGAERGSGGTRLVGAGRLHDGLRKAGPAVVLVSPGHGATARRGGPRRGKAAVGAADGLS